jgi:cell wall-associated NlpC family hydrolase
MSLTDPRINAFRPDLADIALSAVIKADKYVEPVIRQCVTGLVPLYESPLPNAKMVSQVRYGEFLDVFEFRDDDFAWVQNRSDRYVGYLPLTTRLSEKIASLSKRVSALHTFVYSEPDIKSSPVDQLTLGSFVSIKEEADKFVGLSEGGYVFAKHIATADDLIVTDFAFTAGKLLNAPYLWGGRSPMGIDCSGLVQLTLDMAGIDCPRDSDLQAEVFGGPLPNHWRDMAWKRGDLLFFKGHVGIMTSNDHIIHASGDDMKVVVEPLFNLVMRGNDILSMGRLP